MNPDTSVPQVTVEWSPQEIHGIHTAQFRDLAAEKREAGDQAAARELERMAEQSEAALDAALAQWEAEFGEVHRDEAEVDQEAVR
jgi:hypothetical protein